MSFKDLFTKKEAGLGFEWEPLPEFTSLDHNTSWTKKYLSNIELEEAKEKLFNVLHKDLRLTPSVAKMCVDHILGIKAMYNAGYPRDYMKKLLVSKKLVQELNDTKIKLREMNKAYGRSSETIFNLKARLAFGWRDKMNDSLLGVLNRIENTQKRLDSKND